MLLQKNRTERFLEIADPEKAVGLWSHHVFRTTAMTPVGETRKALGRFLNDDIVRWETFDEMKAAMLAKTTDLNGKRLSGYQKICAYAAEFLGERFDEKGEGSWLDVPRWFRVWRRFGRHLDDLKTVRRSPDVRMSFGAPSAGRLCHEKNLHAGRMFFLRRNGVYFLAVVLRPGGTKWWWEIDRANVTWTKNVYDRLIIDSRGGYSWGPIQAEVIDERVAEKDICLFRLDDDELFKAITDPELNPHEVYAHLSCDFDCFVHAPGKSDERFYLRWAVTFNPTRGKYIACNKSRPACIEVVAAKSRKWTRRTIPISDPADAEAVARKVVEINGCVLMPANPSDELRVAVMHALFFVTMPDRRPDEPGGILRGYQLHGRMYVEADGPVRGENVDKLVAKKRQSSEAIIVARRKLVVDTLLARAADAVARRNGLETDEARKRIEAVRGREMLESAAWRWGMMEGNPLNLFKPTPTAGALKLPDLSLAFAFEHLLGLEGASSQRLVQTARCVSLAESIESIRFTRDGKYPMCRLWTPMRGRERVGVELISEGVWFLRDEDRFYLLGLPRFAQYDFQRDLAYIEPQAGVKTESVPAEAYRFFSASRGRTRQDVELNLQRFDWQKINKLAGQGRLYLYAIDFGEDKWLAEAAFTTANVSPCRFVSTIPTIEGPDGEQVLPTQEQALLSLSFIINAHLARDRRKIEGRSWMSYCNAYPDEANRAVVRWPADKSLAEVVRDAVRQDAVLMTDRAYFRDALQAMSYVVMPNTDPQAPGGVYRGYQLRDRVFTEIDNRAQARYRGSSADSTDEGSDKPKGSSDQLKGKCLVDIVQPSTAKELEQEFRRLIESDPLSDKKSASYFKLESPIRITEAYAAAVAREFRRVIYTGTMKYQRQLVRPAHEVALGLWLSQL